MNSTAQKIIDALSGEEVVLLLDTIRYGAWGDCDNEFRDEAGNIETVHCYGYCTNDAQRGGHFKGRKVSAMFRSIYKKLCPDDGIGRYIAHVSDWWGDGSGDMLFLRDGVYQEFEEVTKNWK